MWGGRDATRHHRLKRQTDLPSPPSSTSGRGSTGHWSSSCVGCMVPHLPRRRPPSTRGMAYLTAWEANGSWIGGAGVLPDWWRAQSAHTAIFRSPYGRWGPSVPVPDSLSPSPHPLPQGEGSLGEVNCPSPLMGKGSGGGGSSASCPPSLPPPLGGWGFDVVSLSQSAGRGRIVGVQVILGQDLWKEQITPLAKRVENSIAEMVRVTLDS